MRDDRYASPESPRHTLYAPQATGRLLRYDRIGEQWLSRNQPDDFFLLPGEIADLRVIAIHNDDAPLWQIIGPIDLVIAFSYRSSWMLPLPLTAEGISLPAKRRNPGSTYPCCCLSRLQVVRQSTIVV